jgi:hypothetical protein
VWETYRCTGTHVTLTPPPVQHDHRSTSGIRIRTHFLSGTRLAMDDGSQRILGWTRAAPALLVLLVATLYMPRPQGSRINSIDPWAMLLVGGVSTIHSPTMEKPTAALCAAHIPHSSHPASASARAAALSGLVPVLAALTRTNASCTPTAGCRRAPATPRPAPQRGPSTQMGIEVLEVRHGTHWDRRWGRSPAATAHATNESRASCSTPVDL